MDEPKSTPASKPTSLSHFTQTAFLILFFLFAGAGAWFLDISFWIQPPAKKFEMAWSRDLATLKSNGKLPKFWSEIAEVQLTSDASPVADWIENLKPKIPVKKDGKFTLEVLAIHKLAEFRYGVVLQYSLIDRKSGNLVWQSGRTFELGWVY